MRRLGSVIVIWIGMGFCGCWIHSVNAFDEEFVQCAPEETMPVSVAIVADAGRSDAAVDARLNRFTGYLSEIGAFSSISLGVTDESDLVIKVREADAMWTCGNPQTLTGLSLGLIPTSNTRRYVFAFSIETPAGSGVADVDLFVGAEERYGVIALPLRLSPNWRKPSEEIEPQVLVELKTAILANRELILDAVRARVEP